MTDDELKKEEKERDLIIEKLFRERDEKAKKEKTEYILSWAEGIIHDYLLNRK